MVPCADFVSNVSMEPGAITFNSPGWDMVFAVVYDDRCEIFGGCVYVSEVVHVEVCKLCVNVVGEVVPVCSVVICVGTFGGVVVGSSECVCDD